MSTVEQAATPFWLSGNYAPVLDEITALDLPVTGSVPSDLQGLYVRNGANPQSGWSSHWFFGNGMLHGVRLEGRRGGLVPQPLRAYPVVRGRRRPHGA